MEKKQAVKICMFFFKNKNVQNSIKECTSRYECQSTLLTDRIDQTESVDLRKVYHCICLHNADYHYWLKGRSDPCITLPGIARL